MAKENCESVLYELHCKPEFETMNRKLDKLSNSINGNGHPGLKMESDRNTRWISGIVKAMWLITSAVIGVIAWLVRGHF